MNTTNTNKTPEGIDREFFAVDLEQQREVNKEAPRKKPSRKNDPKYYRPRLRKEGEGKKAVYVGTYQSMIRLLPQKGWIQDRSLPFSVDQHMHYIQEKVLGIFLYIKCRKTLGQNEKCPVCDANWAVWRKATELKDEATLKVAKTRIAKATALCNVLIVADLNNPDLNGEVKLWEHTLPVKEKLLAPLRAGKVSKEVEEQNQRRGFKKETSDEKVEFFVPFHPTEGRNRYLIIEPPKDNQTIVSYSQSYWEEEPSVLGWYEKGGEPGKDKMIVPATTAEIMAVLERAYSLKEFIDDVPSVESMMQQMAEYNQKAMDVGAQPLNESYASGVRPALTPRPTKGNAAEFYKTEDDSGDDDVPVDPETGSAADSHEADPDPADPADPEDDLPF